MELDLPKDAEGRVIPLDTKVLYDERGKDYEVSRYCYSVSQSIPERMWDAVMMDSLTYYTSRLYLTPPDSWEKLEEDLDRALSTPGPDTYASVVCGYFDSANVDCEVCESIHGINGETCNDDAWRDIAARIRKLRGDGE